MTIVDDIRAALAATAIPPDVAARLVKDAPDLWLMSESSIELLASDLALCHPAPQPGEVRARAVALNRLGDWRLTVVAPDRQGLLADTTGVATTTGMTVTAASALTLRDSRQAVHSLRVWAPDLDAGRWEELGARLRQAAAGTGPRPPFVPLGVAEVTSTGDRDDLHLVTVTAPDQRGLLCAICRALAEQSVSIEVAHATGEYGRANDLFLVRGDVDVVDLATRLSSTGRTRTAQTVFNLAGRIPVVGALVRRGLAAVM